MEIIKNNIFNNTILLTLIMFSFNVKSEIIDKAKPKQRNITESVINPNRPEWLWANLGSDIGLGVLESADLNNNGTKELIISGGPALRQARPTMLFIADNSLREFICVADMLHHPIDNKVVQYDEDEALEIIILMKTGVLVIDGVTCKTELIHEFPFEVNYGGIGDLDDNHVLDIVYTLNDDIYTSPINDFSHPIIRSSFDNIKSIVIEQLDNNGDDIAILSGAIGQDSIKIIKGDDLTDISQIPATQTRVFAFADLNNDGTKQLIQASGGADGLRVQNYLTGELHFQHGIYDIRYINFSDIDNNNKLELVLSQTENIRIIDDSGNLLHRFSNFGNDNNHGITNVLIEDFNNGSGIELFFGSGYLVTTPDYFNRFNFSSEEITWKSHIYEGPYDLSRSKNSNIDENEQIIFSFRTTNLGSINGRLGGAKQINIETGIVSNITYLSEDTISASISGNIDSDEALEICFGGNDYIQCKDTLTNEVQFEDMSSGMNVFQIEMFDINNDSINEIVSLGTFSTGGIVNTYDASTGNLIWRSPILPIATFTDYDVDRGFKGLNIINGTMWVTLPDYVLYKLNLETGEIVDTILDSEIFRIIENNGIHFAIKKRVGLGILNLETLFLDDTIYSTLIPLDYLIVSEDNQHILTGSRIEDDNFRLKFPKYDPILLSANNEFSPQFIDVEMYDGYMINRDNLYLSTPTGIHNYNLDILYEEIFSDDFEGE